MNTVHFVNPNGVTIYRTRMTVNGEDVIVSTSGELDEPSESYWETMVFRPDMNGEPDFHQDLAEERHYLSDMEERFGLEKLGVRDNQTKLERIHQLMLSGLMMYGKNNSIRDIVYALSYNDFTVLKP